MLAFDLSFVRSVRLAGFDFGRPTRGRGMEGNSAVCDLLYRGVLVGEVSDYGDGGEVRARIWGESQSVWDALVAEAKKGFDAMTNGRHIFSADEACANAVLEYVDFRGMKKVVLAADKPVEDGWQESMTWTCKVPGNAAATLARLQSDLDKAHGAGKRVARNLTEEIATIEAEAPKFKRVRSKRSA